MNAEEISEAVRQATSRRMPDDPDLRAKLVAGDFRLLGGIINHEPAWRRMLHLTPREIDVAALLREGLTNREIGARLCLSPDTVKTYVSEVLRKLGARNRTQAAAMIAAG